MRRTKPDGIAAVTALLLLVVVGGITTIMLTRMVGEVRNTADDGGIVQSLLLARGTANLAGAVLQGPARGSLQSIVSEESSTTSRWSFGSGSSTSDAPDPDSVSRALTTGSGAVASQFQQGIDDLLCGADTPSLDDGHAMALRIYVTDTACGVGLPDSVALSDGRFVKGQPRTGSGSASDQTYALPYAIVAEGLVGDYRRRLVLQGEYRFQVGRGSFAQYALFTNVHQTPNGSDIWFTDRTLFDGPVHTNERFRFYRNPWFGGEVTSAGCVSAGATDCDNVWGSDENPGAFFYGASNGGFTSTSHMQPSAAAPVENNWYGRHAPDLTGGVDWEASFVPLPENAQDQEQAARDEGLFFGGDVHDLHLYAGLGDGTVATEGNASHQYIEVEREETEERCERRWDWNWGWYWACEDVVVGVTTDRYRYAPATGLQREECNGSCSWTDEGPFNGVVYVDGDVERFRGPARDPSYSDDGSDAQPAIASFAQMTLATSGDVRITGDLAYEDPPCTGSPSRDQNGSVVPGECSNLDADNILGVYSQDGDILIGHNNHDAARNAPDNAVIHGVLMSSTGVVAVEDYDRGSTRGVVDLIGGIIEHEYGAFGTFNASTGNNATGYGRSFTFDRRTAAGLAPPYFPTIGQDGVKSVSVFSYGQREQVF